MDEQKLKKEELAKTFKFCLLNITSASLNTRKEVFQQLTNVVEHGGLKILTKEKFSFCFKFLVLFYNLCLSF